MPRRPNVNTSNTRKPADTIHVERDNNQSFFSQLKAFFQDRRTHYITGAILVALATFLAVAYFSFFFTGFHDNSLLTSPDKTIKRNDIHNVMGLPGAWSSEWLINGSFGISSIALILLLLVFGLKLLHVTKTSGTKWFFHSVFWLLWTSIVLGFAQTMFGFNHWFLQLGGSHGHMLSAWLNSYVYPIGMIMIIVLTLVIYCIVADPHFTDHVAACWGWIKRKFSKQPYDDELFAPQTDETEPTSEDLSNPVPVEDAPVLTFTNTDDVVQIEVSDPAQEQPEDLEVVPVTDDDPLLNVQVEVTNNSAIQVVDELPDPEPLPIDPNAPKVGFKIQETKEDELVAADEVEQDPLEKLGPYDPRKELSHYKFPSLDLLKVYDNESAPVINQQEQQENANRIVTTLRNYGIEIESIKATVGPTVTLYEVVPKAGIRVAKIQNLENDIMMSLSATGIRIIAPMPGKGTVGIEVPNEKPQVVSMHSVLASKRFQEEKKMRLPIAYGRTITNEVFMFDLAKTPHLLVAGATGTGKSVAINAILTSLLYKKHPSELLSIRKWWSLRHTSRYYVTIWLLCLIPIRTRS